MGPFAEQVEHAQVLIVNDDPMNIEVISALLEERKVKSDIALNGNEIDKEVKQMLLDDS